MKRAVQRQIIRMGSGWLRRLLRERPWLGILLIAAAAAWAWFGPSEPPWVDNPGANSGNLYGRVGEVVDGDSLTLVIAEGRVKVRL
ncbi:MAG: hypothetical protein LBV79_10595, partial [Candidatus Adiutrix sp.]|nr:hypothetical protein [Candidatus Adiutrix sp.]